MKKIASSALAAFAELALLACKGPYAPVNLPPVPPSASSSSLAPPIASATPVVAHALKRKDRPFTATKLPSIDLTADVFLRGLVDPAFRASIDAATKGLRLGATVAGPGGRFVVSGEDAQKRAQIVLFDIAGKRVDMQAGEHPFFAPDGSVVFHVGQRVWSWDGATAPRALFADQPALCVARACKPRSIPIAISADSKVVLVGIFSGGFVSDDQAFSLDLATGVTTPVVARAKDVAYLSGTTMADGTYCSFRTQMSRRDEPAPGTLLCFPPPWSSGRALLETNGGAWVALGGGEGGKIVTGDVKTIHVVDAATGEHRSYPSPEGGGSLMPLTDGRSAAVGADAGIVVVDLVDETYALYPTAQTIVMPLALGVKGFISTGDGTATLVRYE